MKNNERRNPMVTRLPEFKGYTVDYRLRQFRKAIFGKRLEFIEFDSKKGQELLNEMIEQRKGGEPCA